MSHFTSSSRPASAPDAALDSVAAPAGKTAPETAADSAQPTPLGPSSRRGRTRPGGSRALALALSLGAGAALALTGCGSSASQDSAASASASTTAAVQSTDATDTLTPDPSDALDPDPSDSADASDSADPDPSDSEDPRVAASDAETASEAETASASAAGTEGSGTDASATRTWSSAAAGVAFDYPADWSVVPLSGQQGVEVRDAAGEKVARLSLAAAPPQLSPVGISSPQTVGEAPGAVSATGLTGKIVLGYFPGQAVGSGQILYGVDPAAGHSTTSFSWFRAPSGTWVSFMGTQDAAGMDQAQLRIAAQQYAATPEFAQAKKVLATLRTTVHAAS